MNEDSLSGWVVKNGFPSQMVDDAHTGRSLDGVVQELVETKENYERIRNRLSRVLSSGPSRCAKE